MYTKTFLLAALTAGACAQMPALLPRKTESAPSSATSSISPECESRIMSWAAAIPTPAPSLQSAMNDDAEGGMAEDGLPGLCRFGTSLPKDQAAAFTSYNLDMYSYLSSQSSNLVALASTCSDDMGAPSRVITSQLNELLTVYSSFSADGCKSVAASATTTTSTADGAKSTGTASGSATFKAAGASSSVLNPPQLPTVTSVSDAASSASSVISSVASPTSNAGAKETGMRAAAALAAAFGAAVAL
ncbi:hypothetical protein GGR52DRAFT_568095 [Hypoxylon sp. FL1284]|nr:hypothetical protein GGR52DRAFT_568095 [Hypoxylon sp. FL1284]